MTIEANIVDVLPHCVYQGTIYEQRVVLQAASVEFGCFDPDMHASESMISERCEIDLYPAVPTAVERAVETDVGIKPNPDEPQDYSDHQFCGRVVSVADGWPKSVKLDVSVGTVTPRFSKETPEHIEYRDIVTALEVGDIVRVTAGRTDVRGIEPI